MKIGALRRWVVARREKTTVVRRLKAKVVARISHISVRNAG